MYRPISDILADFKKPVNPDLISTKPVFRYGKKTEEISYIHWYTLIDELDRITPGWEWTVRVQFVPDRCVIEGRLTIKAQEGEFSREATGVEPLDSKGFGDPVYSAEASALRRAMAKFGYALDLWRKEERTSQRVSESDLPPNRSVDQNLDQKIKTGADLAKKAVTQKQIALLYAVAKNEAGLTEEDVKLIIKGWGYESAKDIAIKDFDPILEAIKNAAKYVTVAQRKELANWWRSQNIPDTEAKRAISGMGFDSTQQILRSDLNGVKQGILAQFSEQATR